MLFSRTYYLMSGKLRLLSRGSASEVYAFGEEAASVVLKVVGREQRREARHLRAQWKILAGLSHQGIVRALKYQENVAFMGTTIARQARNSNILVLEYASHGSLLSLKHSQLLTSHQIPALCRSITQALVFLHSQDIAHRDIKLDNILVFEDEKGNLVPKLSDFGFAGSMDASTDYKGTPKGYMAPQIHQCQTEKDTPYLPGPADIFALGVVFFALVAGRLPFEQATTDNHLYGLINEDKWECFWASHPIIGRLQADQPDKTGQFKSLFQKMVLLSGEERPKCEDVLGHDWLQ